MKLLKHFFIKYVFCIVYFLLQSNNAWCQKWPSPEELNWENTTEYSKTWYVDKNHPKASDTGSGMANAPFSSIGRAVERAQPGEQILIFEGVYREKITPIRGGLAADKMISYRAAPGEEVIVKGSKILNTTWEKVKLDTLLPSGLLKSKENQASKAIWMADIPEYLTDSLYDPIKLINIEDNEYQLMPWAKECKGSSPWNLYRVLLFQSGTRLNQVDSLYKLSRSSASFYIDHFLKKVFVHTNDKGDLNSKVIEIALNSHLFRPLEIGLGYIHIQGIIFEHCANGFLRTGTGAVSTTGGHHWIIEDNIIRECNSSGLEVGHAPFERNYKKPANIIPRKNKNNGGVIICNNEIYNCGTAGIRSLTIRDGFFYANHIHHCGWHNAEFYWECGGIKLLNTSNTLVKNNHVHNILGGTGIWLDWNNRYSRVTKNLIHDIATIQGAIFIEASRIPNLVDHNFIWGIKGNGVFLNDSDSVIVLYNLIADISTYPIHGIVATKRSLNGRELTCKNNTIKYNVFINNEKPYKIVSDENYVDENLFVFDKENNRVDFKQIRNRGFDENSCQIKASASFKEEVLIFSFETDSKIPKLSKPNFVFDDFFNVKPIHQRSYGPFMNLTHKTNVTVNPLSTKAMK